MGTTKSNTPLANVITKPVEGTTVWDETTLKFFFATDADKAQVEADTEASKVFAPGGTAFATFNALSASDAGENVIRTAFTTAAAAFSAVASISFSASATFDDADLKVVGADNYGTGVLGSANTNNVYGSMDFPGGNVDVPGPGFESFLLLNPKLNIMTQGPATGGGHFALTTTMHELGHGIGLGHPHDNGGGTTDIANVNRDDTAEFPSEVPLDNERYTIMSYESGGLNQDTPRTSGHAVTPMAIDIAALQNMYGATTHNTGGSTYTLTDAGTTALDTSGDTISIGSAWYSIWDTAGTDEIKYGGAMNALINLNDAPLTTTDDAMTKSWVRLLKGTDTFSGLPNELKNDLADPKWHAGGFFSRLFDDAGTVQLGGYSIAKGVDIEKGTGGSGKDVIIGNEKANTLEGNGGNDLILGSSGDDTLNGSAGDDTLGGGEGDDRIDGGTGAGDVALFSDICANYEIEKSSEGFVTIRHVDGSMTDGVDLLSNVEIARFTDGDIDLTEDEPGCPPIDFIFLVDLSGSFGDDLPNFVASAPSIAATVSAVDPRAQFAIASFVDIPDGSHGAPGDYGYQPELALTDDPGAFQSALGGLTLRNGADFPEAQWVGLFGAALGLGLGLREDSRKIILIATDATAHPASDYGLSEAGIQAFLDDNSTDVIGGPREVADVGDVGDTDPEFDDGLEPLFGAFAELTGFGEVTPIFAVTSSVTTFYEEFNDSLLTPGAVAPLGFSGDDIADAVSVALADLAGEISNLGTAGNDSLVGTPDPDGIFGLGGSDTIQGLGDNDLLDGGSGSDLVEGGEGNDELRGGTNNDTLDGGTGDDLLRPGLGFDRVTTGSGADTVAGAASELDSLVITDFTLGEDVILVNGARFKDANFSMTGGILAIDTDRDGFTDLTLDTGGDFHTSDFFTRPAIGGTEIGAPREVFGTEGSDRLLGSAGADTLRGLGGDDTVNGRAGDDLLDGGEGNDRVVGRGGNDDLIGGADDDLLLGNGGKDTLSGGEGNDTLRGGVGGDELFGEADNDTLEGRGGEDTLDGGDGDDLLIGGRRDDTLTGGDGDDIFQFRKGAGSDTLTDFEQGRDMIQIGLGAASFSDLSITQSGDDALITFSNVQILALDQTATDFTADDFDFLIL